MDLKISGKVALVTAASQGIGFAVARELGREGARVLLNSRDPARAEAAARRLTAEGSTVESCAGDVTDPATCARLVEECRRRFHGLDILFASAAGPRPGGFEEVEPADYEQALKLNLLSIVHLCRAALPPMKAQGGGRIVALTSMAVKQPVDGLLLSNMARAGAAGFLKSLANEVGRHGITVNTVCPGYTTTERLEALAASVAGRTGRTEAAVREEWARSIPLGRLGRPEEIAALVAFLASERASFIHGTVIAADGGSIRSLL
jgi:3-oxoacyl-[acyl-carrier protein] reductase